MTHGGKRKGAGRPKAPKPKARIEAVRLDAEMRSALGRRAKAEGKTGSVLLREALAQYLGRPLWTKEPPTNPGWYWARAAGARCLVETWDGSGRLRARVHEDSRVVDLPMRIFDLWWGPVETPPLPEEGEA